MGRKAANAAATQKLEELQQEVREICEPRYHEFHNDVDQYGFSRITISKTHI
jgi:hypothetical protein